MDALWSLLALAHKFAQRISFGKADGERMFITFKADGDRMALGTPWVGKGVHSKHRLWACDLSGGRRGIYVPKSRNGRHSSSPKPGRQRALETTRFNPYFSQRVDGKIEAEREKRLPVNDKRLLALQGCTRLPYLG